MKIIKIKLIVVLKILVDMKIITLIVLIMTISVLITERMIITITEVIITIIMTVIKMTGSRNCMEKKEVLTLARNSSDIYTWKYFY